jgi:hypothetical protein
MARYVLKGRIIDAVSDTALERGLLCFGETIEYVGPEGDSAFPMTRKRSTSETARSCRLHRLPRPPHRRGGFRGVAVLRRPAYRRGLPGGAPPRRRVHGTPRDERGGTVPVPRRGARCSQGPRILPGGKILGITSGHVDGTLHLPKSFTNENDHCHRLVDGGDDCVLGVREQFRAGARFIKICAQAGSPRLETG